MNKTAVCGALAVALFAAPATAQSWQVVARSDIRTYLISLDELTVTDGLAAAQVATVPRRGEASDYAHSVSAYEVRCGQDRWRIATVTEYGGDGARADVFAESEDWEAIRPQSQAELIKMVACDNHRSQGALFDSVRAYIDAGRP